MKKVLGSAVLALIASFALIAVTGVNASAQYNRNDGRWGRNNDRNRDWRRDRRDNDDWRRNNGRYGNNNQYEINRGFQEGVNTGASDAQRGQSYSPQRSHFYRNPSSQAFREGFVRGYDQGYRQYAGYRNGNGRYGNNRYPTGGYGGYGGYGGSGNQNELNRGYQQGLETGSSDGQRGQSYDPQRSRHYRNASTQAFREGFVRGYDEGYRRYGNNRGGYRNGGIGIGDILGGIITGRP